MRSTLCAPQRRPASSTSRRPMSFRLKDSSTAIKERWACSTPSPCIWAKPTTTLPRSATTVHGEGAPREVRARAETLPSHLLAPCEYAREVFFDLEGGVLDVLLRTHTGPFSKATVPT